MFHWKGGIYYFSSSPVNKAFLIYHQIPALLLQDSEPCEPWILRRPVLVIALQICGQVSLGDPNKLDFDEFWIAFNSGIKLKV